jgi:hypothetical protein
MASPTSAQLASQMSALIERWNTYNDQMKAWLGGVADGGPNGDGKYPLTDFRGITFLVACPAAQEARVSTTVDSAQVYADAAQGSATAAAAARTGAETARDVALSYRDAAVAARNLAQTYSDTSGSNAANALAYATDAQSARDTAVASATTAAEDAASASADAAAADASRIAAAASAAAAATFDPSLYATHADVDDAIAALVDSSPAALDTLNELAAALGDDPNFATTVNNNIATKLPTADFVWSGLGGKPATFPPSAHTHVISDVTGLQTALDAKLASAAYSWSTLPDKPATFAPSAHTHIIGDVTGLQAALDAKFDKAGGAIGGGVDFGNVIGASNVDISKHVQLHNAGYGFGITGNRLNYVVAAPGSHRFIVGGVDILSITNGGVYSAYPVDASSIIRSTGIDAFHTSGTGAEFFWYPADNCSYIVSIDRTAGAHKPLKVDCLTFGVQIAGVLQMSFDGTSVTRKNANSTTMTAQPRIFMQSADPGAAAADNDLWVW